MDEIIQSKVTTENHSAGCLSPVNLQWLRGTSLDLPPDFVNMSPVERIYERIIQKYTQRIRALEDNG